MEIQSANVLLAVADAAERGAIARVLATHRVTAVESSEAALEKLAEGAHELVVFSEDLAADPSALLRELAARAPRRWTPLLALGHHESCAKLLALGADDFAERPCNAVELLARVRALLRVRARMGQLEAERDALAELAITDGLTGLYNHRHFIQRLDEEFRRAVRYGQPLAVLLLDLDRFKAVNDTFGHPAGDAALRHAAEILRSQLRVTDLLARYGGEEFAAILPQTTHDGADLVARRIAAALEQSPLLLRGQGPIRLTASIGVAHVPAAQITGSDALLEAADEALYRAKRAGRNQVMLAGAVAQGAVSTRPGPN